jgi:bifunctional DNA-binding transcriptional regulator/antitoxin component of YhaV-PrlF toxin-antitoxin module
MSKRTTRKGQVNVPDKTRDGLWLAAEDGDGVGFELNAAGEVVLRKSSPTQRPPHREEELRCRAAELRSVLRGLE